MKRSEQYRTMIRKLRSGESAARQLQALEPGDDTTRSLTNRFGDRLSEDEVRALKASVSADVSAYIDTILAEKGRFELLEKGVENDWIARKLPPIITQYFFDPDQHIHHPEAFEVGARVVKQASAFPDELDKSSATPGAELIKHPQQRGGSVLENLIDCLDDDQRYELAKRANKHYSGWAVRTLHEAGVIGEYGDYKVSRLFARMHSREYPQVDDPSDFLRMALERFDPETRTLVENVIEDILEGYGAFGKEETDRDELKAVVAEYDFSDRTVDELNWRYEQRKEKYDDEVDRQMVEIVQLGADHPGADEDFLRAAIDHGIADQVETTIEAGADVSAWDLYAAAKQAPKDPGVLDAVLQGASFDDEQIQRAFKKYAESATTRGGYTEKHSPFAQGIATVEGVHVFRQRTDLDDRVVLRALLDSDVTIGEDWRFYQALLGEAVALRPSINRALSDEAWRVMADCAGRNRVLGPDSDATHNLIALLIEQGHAPDEQAAKTIRDQSPELYDLIETSLPPRKRNALRSSIGKVTQQS